MGNSTINEGEIFLDGKKYLLYAQGNEPGRVRMEMLTQFPEQRIDGPPDYANELYVSKWIMDDWTGGMGIEEYDPKLPNYTYWHSVNVDHKGHMTLLPYTVTGTLPTPPDISNGNFEVWTTSSDAAGWTETSGALGTFRQVSGALAVSGYAMEISNGGGVVNSISQSFGNDSDISGKPFSALVYAYYVGGVSNTATITLADDITGTSVNITGTSYAQYKVTRQMNVSATSMSIKIQNGAANTAVYIDSVDAGSIGTTLGCACEFNSDLYFSWGRVLTKLNKSTGNTFTVEGVFPATITELVSALSGPHMAVFLGDSDAYWYRDISGTWAQTTGSISESGNAVYGLEYQNKLWKISTDGTIAYCATPFTASPAWTVNGKLPLPVNYCKGLFIGEDADGNEIIYASTRVGLYAHDTTNARWDKTKCYVPDVSTNGMGFGYWQGWHWYSAGIRLLRYKPGSPSVFEEAGRDQKDGPPGWVSSNTYISRLIPGTFWMYVLSSGGTYDKVMKLNLAGAWHTVFTPAGTNSHNGIISSVYANRFWFNGDGSLYYLTEPGSSVRPGKISGYEYAPMTVWDGYLVSPWFDAGSDTEVKTALSLDIYANGVSTNQFIFGHYQLDHPAGRDVVPYLDTGYVEFNGGNGLSSNGLTSWTFGVSGVPFKAIRYTFRLWGVTGELEKAVDVQSVTLRYIKNNDVKWGYAMTLDCRKLIAGRTPQQMESELKTLAESTTLVPLSYRDSNRDSSTPHYIKVQSLRALKKAGQDVEGVYEVSVIEP